jgi:hypothetical protein
MTLFALDGALDWNLISRERITSSELGYIEDRYYSASTPNIIIGMGIVEGKPNWKWAGRLIQYTPATPSSTGIFPNRIEVFRTNLYLGRYQHFKLGDYSPRPYEFKIEFPKWFIDCDLEMWWYDET